MIKALRAPIVHKESWRNYHLFSLESPRVSSQAQPGQFIMVRITAHPYPLLRRPFSIHSKDEKNIEIFFKESGLGTTLLGQKTTGDSIDILGPLGKGFATGVDFNGKEVVAVGGGRGIAPLFFLAQTLRSSGSEVKIFYGGTALEDLPLKEKFEINGFDLSCSTDDGSFGFKGLVSDLFELKLKNLNPSYIFACGPEPMMEKIAKISQEIKIPAEFSLESVMGCGFGACWGCVKRIRKDGEEAWSKVCKEGPIFSAEEVIWHKEEK